VPQGAETAPRASKPAGANTKPVYLELKKRQKPSHQALLWLFAAIYPDTEPQKTTAIAAFVRFCSMLACYSVARTPL
jgi:hypothetical protein